MGGSDLEDDLQKPYLGADAGAFVLFHLEFLRAQPYPK